MKEDAPPPGDSIPDEVSPKEEETHLPKLLMVVGILSVCVRVCVCMHQKDRASETGLTALLLSSPEPGSPLDWAFSF